MVKKHVTFFVFTFFIAQLIFSQVSFEFTPEKITERLKEDVYTLSSAEMEGREAGTEGERMAASYIQAEMEEAGLSPLFGESYLQEFEFYGDWTFGPENFLVINEEEFSLNQDFFVLPNSAADRVYAQAVYVGFGLEEENYNDYENLSGLEDKVFFMEYFLPRELDDGSARLPLEILQKKIETATKKGALAVIFLNSREDRTDPPTGLNQRLGKENIPVFFAKTEVLEYWQQMAGEEYIFLSAELERESYTAYNVGGYWDNQAVSTVVIGGHYDHLGLGGSGSRSPGEVAIHYGADDNASGIAGMLEAARFLTQSDLTSNNYIFIGFSAEEKGLLGSRHFTQSDAYEMEQVNYMLNFDMIGRKEDNNITLYGTGTSPVWESTIDTYAGEELNVRKSPGGQGGSDHANFYRQDIPVLFFFTGIHDDYHKPTDTPDKINFEGMHTILSFSYDMMEALDGMGKLAFTETAVTRRGSRRGQGPTLGLMPDHAFEGEGLKIQAVSENQPAQKAGMKDGDIIIRIGEVRVSDIYTYMEALGTVNASETVKVLITREGEELELEVKL